MFVDRVLWEVFWWVIMVRFCVVNGNLIYVCDMLFMLYVNNNCIYFNFVKDGE